MISKETVLVSVKAVMPYTVEILKRTIVTDDGAVIAMSDSPRAVHPGDDLSGEPNDVQAVCAAWFTPARIAMFMAATAP